MKLRYTIEGKFSATFTATKIVKHEGEAIRVALSLLMLNQKEGYKMYSSFILYDNNDQIIKRFPY